MDFVRLGDPYTTQYYPTDIIEGYTSLIWTERFQTHGEFQLKTYDVDRLKDLLPEGTFVSHLETQEVMQVETHEIAMVGEGADSLPELTIKGRSATTILEHRFVEANYGKRRRMRKKYTATAACGVLIYNAIDNNSGADLTRGDDDPDTEGVVNHYDWNTKDVIPNVAISEIVPNEGELRWWKLKEGMLYPQLMRIMVDADLGLRTMRPVLPNSLKIVTVKKPLAERGEVVRTLKEDVTQLRFEIYSGTDRSASVQLSVLQGHLANPQYLESNQHYKNAVEVRSGEVNVKDVYRGTDNTLTGWHRKVMDFDAGTPEIPPQPEKPDELRRNATKKEKEDRAKAMDAWIVKNGKWKNKKATIIADFKDESEKEAKALLKSLRRIDMISGDSSDLSPYKYKTHYFLGDTIKIVGDYGKSAKMLVVEYVRTEDAEGDRGFPGLVVP